MLGDRIAQYTYSTCTSMYALLTTNFVNKLPFPEAEKRKALFFNCVAEKHMKVYFYFYLLCPGFGNNIYL